MDGYVTYSGNMQKYIYSLKPHEAATWEVHEIQNWTRYMNGGTCVQ